MHTHLNRHPASLPTDIPIDQGTITLYSPILDSGSLNVCDELIKSLHWRQDNINIRGVLTPIPLRDNTLLIMAGSMQHHWRHQIPKTSRPTGPRVNLTFRYIPKLNKNTSR